MAKDKLSKEKVKELLEELGRRKEIKNAKIQLAADAGEAKGGDVIGNVSGCTDEICGGGVGNVSACDDEVCHEPGADPDTMGNTHACGDWVCG